MLGVMATWQSGFVAAQLLGHAPVRQRSAAKVSPDSLCPGLDSNLVHSLTVYAMDVVSRLVV
jgi:hypothetical protein